jgi:DNA repair exonuclease SbcCD ATPase subunit
MIDANETLLNLRYVSKRVSELTSTVDILNGELLKVQQEQAELDRIVALASTSKEYYIKAIDLIYNQSIGELEKTINLGLQYIFHDKQFHLKVRMEDKRGKVLVLTLYDNNTGMDVNLKRGIGAGVRSVISFIFKVYYLLAKQSYPVLFLDEAYSEISADYVERFFSFIQGLCKDKGLIVIMISHDERFMEYADYRYSIADGRIQNEH